MNLYILTGTTRGLGKALLDRLIKKKDTFIITLSSSATAREQNWFNYQADLGVCERIPDLFDTIKTDLDMTLFRKCVLINNAGTVNPILKVKDGSDKDVIRNVHVNLISPMLISKHMLSLVNLEKTDTRIINISSGAAVKPYQGWSSYCSSKAGLDHFSRVMAEEMSSMGENLQCITFNPGVMNTSMQDSIRSSCPDDFPQRERFVQFHKNSDLADCDLVAKVLLKYDDENLFVNGETYKVTDLTE